MEDFDHLLCEKHLNNETLELISAGKFKENDSFFSKISCKIIYWYFSQFWLKISVLFFGKNGHFKLQNSVR